MGAAYIVCRNGSEDLKNIKPMTARGKPLNFGPLLPIIGVRIWERPEDAPDGAEDGL
jgi:hypothetical protein